MFRTGELEITNAANGASVRALAADASAMGKRAWCITLDEVANWPETRKARRFWGVLTSGNRKIADCRTVVITNAGDPQHWAWKRRETARTSRNWRFVSIPGPLPWLTPVDLAILQENAETESEYERLHLNKWTTSEDRLATRADLAACTILPGPVPPVRGTRYVATLDVGIVNDRTVLTVMHTEETPAGRHVVLDRIERWQGSRSAPVDLGEVRDTLLALTTEYYSAEVVLDPHQAVLIAQEAWARGESAGINRSGGGDGRALRRRASDPRRPRAMRRRPARAWRSVGRGTCRPGYRAAKSVFRGADAVRKAEGNIAGGANASRQRTPRGRRTRACAEPPCARTGRARARPFA